MTQEHSLVQIGAQDFLRDGLQILEWSEQIVERSEGEFTVDALLDRFNDGALVFYYRNIETGENKGIVAVTVVTYAHGRTMAIIGAAGTTEGDWEGLTGLFDHLARALDCTSFELKGRRGFLKKFEPFGWTEKYTTITHEVT